MVPAVKANDEELNALTSSSNEMVKVDVGLFVTQHFEDVIVGIGPILSILT